MKTHTVQQTYALSSVNIVKLVQRTKFKSIKKPHSLNTTSEKENSEFNFH